MQYAFNSGRMFAIVNGVALAFAALQEATVDFSFTLKSLYGQNLFPLTTGRSEGKITGKAKNGAVNGTLYNALFFNGTVTPGQLLVAAGEAATVAAADPYTVVAANGAQFSEDLGVTYADSGVALVAVAAAPTKGQYSVDPATGTYTFSADDTGKNVKLSYTYTAADTGQQIVAHNDLAGEAPTFVTVLSNPYKGKQLNLHLLACASSKLSFGFKQGDFTQPELDFECFANEAGDVYKWSVTE